MKSEREKKLRRAIEFFEDHPNTRGYVLVEEVRRLKKELKKAKAVRECPHCGKLI